MNDSSIARIFQVLAAPARTFEAIKVRPTWLVALLVISICGVLATTASVGKIDFAEVMREELRDSHVELSEEDIASQAEFMGRFGSMFAYGGAVIGPWIAYPLIALLLLALVGMVGSSIEYKQSLAVTLYGAMPWAVSSLLTAPIALARDSIDGAELEYGTLLPSNLYAFFGAPEMSAATRTLAASADFFSLWNVILLTIGLRVVGGVSRGKAVTVTLGLWLTWILIRIGLASVGQIFGGG